MLVVFLLKPKQLVILQAMPYLFEMVLSRGMKIEQVKKFVSDELAMEFDRVVPTER